MKAYNGENLIGEVKSVTSIGNLNIIKLVTDKKIYDKNNIITIRD